MSSVTMLREVVDVVIGVDTHVDTHAAAAVDARTGAVLEEITVAACAAGYELLTRFADDLTLGEDGEERDPQLAGTGVRAWAIEGTGSHGAGLARHLEQGEEIVLEVDRPERAKRRNGAKSDSIDAVRAAREALSRARVGTPRAGSGQRQALSMLLAARRSAVAAAAVAKRQLFSLLITAPEPLRARLRDHKPNARVTAAARLRLHSSMGIEEHTAVTSLRRLARRIQALTTEVDEAEKDIRGIVKAWRPDLLDQHGVGPIVAATVLCAWSHPGRIHSEAAFAMLAGVAPIPANSGQTQTRYRINHHGDRALNRALHTVVITRQRRDPDTRTYTDRRTTEGKNPREIRRCLKRYVARDLYRLLEHPETRLDRT